jgi:hypothetical protein
MSMTGSEATARETIWRTGSIESPLLLCPLNGVFGEGALIGLEEANGFA